MGVAQNAQGWTDITPSGDARQIYVDNVAGNDANPGTIALPLKSVGAAVLRMRNGFPDLVYLKKGGVWYENVSWPTRGRSAAEPTGILSYGPGTVRPEIRPPSGVHAIEVSNGPSTPNPFVVFKGLKLYNWTRDPANGTPNTAASCGIRWYGGGSDVLIEDCDISYFVNGVSINGIDATYYLNRFTLRRSVIANSYHSTAHGEGIYITWAGNILIEDSIFDHNGWDETAPGADADDRSHNIYIDNEQPVGETLPIVRNVLLTRASSHGIQIRCGGTVSNIYVCDCPIGVLFGGGDGFETKSPLGVPIDASDIVIEGSRDITGANATELGWGLDVVNVRSGAIRRVIVTQDRSADGSNAHGVDISQPTSNLALVDLIVWNWHNPRQFEAGVGVTETRTYFGAFGGANTPGFADPGRTLARYNAEVLGGAANAVAFITRARQQSRDNWDERYTAAAAVAWVEGGFGLSATGGSGGGDTTAPTATLSVAGVTNAGATSHGFSVTYADNVAVLVSSLGSGNVRVTGPNGFSQIASFVGVDVNSNGTPRVASYRITPPGGAWDFADNGTYTVSLVAGQVRDTAGGGGNAAAAGDLGTFVVNIPAADTTGPTATLQAADVTGAGWSSYAFSVTYADDVAVRASSLRTGNVLVTGPNGFGQAAVLQSVSPAATDGTPRTATYSITAPGGTWNYSDNGEYTIALVDGQVTDTAPAPAPGGGNPAAGAVLGTFKVNVPYGLQEVIRADAAAIVQDGVQMIYLPLAGGSIPVMGFIDHGAIRPKLSNTNNNRPATLEWELRVLIARASVPNPDRNGDRVTVPGEYVEGGVDKTFRVATKSLRDDGYWVLGLK